MRMRWFNAFVSFPLAVLFCGAAWASVPNTNSAVPGTLNYVEGNASIGSQDLNSKSIGSAELQPGQSLTTAQGKAEVLLTPGVFLRLGDNSEVKMVSPSLTNTEVQVERGNAMIEVAEIHPENDLRVSAAGTTTRLLKTGLYDFNMRQDELRVFDGQAKVENGREDVKVKGSHEIMLAPNEKNKSHKFDKKEYEEGDLYRWSSLRSSYLAEANVDEASNYMNSSWGPGPGWWGTGWYFDPYFDAFTFMPGDGIFYSPFGWGFYSPWMVYDAPFYGYGYGGYHHFSDNYHHWGPGTHYVAGDYAHGIYHGPGARMRSGPVGIARGFGGFRGAGGYRGGGFHSTGGFHGAVGGFHGGFGGFGGGGGFHGGGGGHGR